jgi:DNA invertase Pin-like site-specific DNA recombinase
VENRCQIRCTLIGSCAIIAYAVRMIGVYVRISSHSQKSDSQQAAIGQWLERHGHDLPQVRWYVDTETARTLQRKGFQALQADIFRGEVKTVVVWKLDRLARSLREGVKILTDWCERGVRVVSVTQQIDLSGTIGHLVAGVLFAIAEIELQHTQERQAVGIAVAKAKGLYTGRKKGSLKAKPERAKELRAKGLNAKEIANALQISERTIYRYLAI